LQLLSLPFVLFVAATFVVFHLLPERLKRPCLLVASYAFYCTWGLVYAALLASATFVAYVAGLRLDPRRSADSRPNEAVWLLGSIGLFFGTLFAFKYLPAVAPLLHWEGGLRDVVIPLGISYYTFRLVSYVIDVHWGRVTPERDLVSFAAYVAFFPHLFSGPIQRSGDFLDQVHRPFRVDETQLRGGLRLILFGLFKKLVVADRLAFVVSSVFDSSVPSTGLALLIATYAFAFQLYADFSGVIDIAIGLGRLFGIEAPPNFANPYYAPNIQQFWRRWNMTLTSWLTDYLFTPLHLALRSFGALGLAVAILINMLAIGAWHGARWTYLLFGLIHAVFIIVSAFTLRRRDRLFKNAPRVVVTARKILGPLLVFHLVLVSLIFFRASSIPAGFFFLTHLVPTGGLAHSIEGLHGMGLTDGHLGIVGFLGIPVMELIHLTRQSGQLRRFLDWSPLWLRWGIYYAAVLVTFVLGQTETRTFIYANF
jgi:D-alanyl-lipoteichoic acid acyltransferase DltB (MBOAT superfamily)